MTVLTHAAPEEANAAATALLAGWLTTPGVVNVMLAAGNTPLDLYRRIAQKQVSLAHLNIFALDEYVGVPRDEPRNCANLIRRTAVEPWGVPPGNYFAVSSLEGEALESVRAHERRLTEMGGLDVIVLGLGQNGHLGFNEPGSAEDTHGRVVELDQISIEANRLWFDGEYAPSFGVTVGMKTILAARRILLMASGAHKTAAVQAMLEGPRSNQCPASLLQGHPNVTIVLDQKAAASLHNEATRNPQGCFAGIDVGGTKIAAGLVVLPGGHPLARRLIRTQPTRGGRAVLDDVLGLARELAAEALTLDRRVEAIGLGVCELVDRGGALASANCLEWLDLPVREELSTIAPTVIEADVRAAALAEGLLGAGRSFHSFLYVTVGTGISSCLMIEGAAYLGARGLTGTMASSSLSLACEACGHVGSRTLEDIAAGPALVARFDALHGHAGRGHDVLAAATAGDAVAGRIVRAAAEALGSQVGLLVNVLDPEAVVVGGGLGLSEGIYWEQFLTATRAHIYSSRHRNLPVLRAAAGADAGWIGAAAKARHESGDAREERGAP